MTCIEGWGVNRINNIWIFFQYFTRLYPPSPQVSPLPVSHLSTFNNTPPHSHHHPPHTCTAKKQQTSFNCHRILQVTGYHQRLNWNETISRIMQSMSWVKWPFIYKGYCSFPSSFQSNMYTIKEDFVSLQIKETACFKSVFKPLSEPLSEDRM